MDNEKVNEQVQDFLNHISKGFVSSYRYAFEYNHKKTHLLLVGIPPGGAFDKAGIKPGR